MNTLKELNFVSKRLLTKEEEIELAKIIQSSDKDSKEYKEAFDLMIECNLKLLISEVNKLKLKDKIKYCEWDDLLSEGYLGLYIAVEKYNPQQYKECRFATYAKFCIRGKILLSIQKLTLIQIPRHLYTTKNKLKNGKSDELTDRDLDNIAKSEIEYISTEDKLNIEDCKSNSKSELCFDDVLTDKAILPDKNCELLDLVRYFICILDGFKKRDQEIVMEFLLDDENTLKSVGDKYGLSEERVRQILFDVKKELRIKWKVEK